MLGIDRKDTKTFVGAAVVTAQAISFGKEVKKGVNNGNNNKTTSTSTPSTTTSTTTTTPTQKNKSNNDHKESKPNNKSNSKAESHELKALREMLHSDAGKGNADVGKNLFKNERGYSLSLPDAMAYVDLAREAGGSIKAFDYSGTHLDVSNNHWIGGRHVHIFGNHVPVKD